MSYPDITLIPGICRILDISEHELITASTDTDARKIKHEARNFRMIRGLWFWVPTILYAVALLICFICNLAVDHTLSWFFIVLASIVCAYTFVPTVVSFFESKKLLAFCVSTYLSICLLLLTCAVYTNGLSWLLTACIGVLIGYELLFVPIFLSKTNISRYKIVISFTMTYILTVLLLMNIHIWNPFSLIPSIMITSYAFIPIIFCAVICTFHFDSFLKAGICVVFSTAVFYFTEYVVGLLFGIDERPYQVNFNDWQQCLEGNIYLIFLISFLLVSVLFIGMGIFRICKKKNK